MNSESHHLTPIDDDYGTCRETWAELRLRPGSLSLAAAAETLGLQADGLGTGSVLLSSRGMVPSRDLRRHLDWLLSRLDGSKEALASLRNHGADTEIYCPWFGEMGGPTFWPAQMRGIAALGLDLVLDYSWADPLEKGEPE